jgi:hypothetical protein
VHHVTRAEAHDMHSGGGQAATDGAEQRALPER